MPRDRTTTPRWGGTPRVPGARAAFVAVAVVAALSGCGDGADGGAESPRGGTVVVCLSTQPESLNSFASPDEIALDLLPVLYTPLLGYGAEGDLRPGLARGWTWSEDSRVLRLALRPDVSWHDGEPVTAGDVVWSIRTAADPEFQYWQGEDFAAVDTAYAAGADTVVVELAQPDAGFTEAVGRLPIMPAHLLAGMTPEEFGRAPYHREPVGNGPYEFVERRVDGSILMRRNEDYPQELGRGILDRILLRPVAELSAQLVELRTGGAHACVTSLRVAQDVQDAEALRAAVVGPVGIQVLPLRNDRPPFDDPRVRRAFSAALDRSQIARLVSPVAEPAGTFMPRSSPFRSDSLRQPDASPELAATLLDSAGWRLRDGAQVRSNAAGEPLSFTITAPQPYRDMLTLVQEQLRRVGIDAELRLMEWSAYVGLLQDPERRPVAMGLTFSPSRVLAYDPYAELHSEGFSNLAGYSDPRVDSLVETLGRTGDVDARRRMYDQLQRQVARDVPMIYTVYVPRLLALRRELQGVEATPAGPFATVTEWRLTD